jgi:hypothetical protein
MDAQYLFFEEEVVVELLPNWNLPYQVFLEVAAVEVELADSGIEPLILVL